ncbi:metallophosphoesterase family protein [Insolitispirillum peregrinum]|uniref:metallophosphoesterase family protein n=1 Tax=Insolitispirillum peregrinum TaxID=80876 RepID=UPI0036225B61
MLSFLKRFLSPSASADPATIPESHQIYAPRKTTLYAFGDIHGQIRQLQQAIDSIVKYAEDDRSAHYRSKVVFLGDYVDRGEDSRAVLDGLMRLPTIHPQIDWIFLAGNHEVVMQGFLTAPQDHLLWLEYGGCETLASYGVAPPASNAHRDLMVTRDAFARALPPAHLAFLQSMPIRHLAGDYLFVHAGLRPGIPLDRQSQEDMQWIRGDFLEQPYWHGKCVVHGHTIEAQPTVLPWRIGLDTGAYSGSPLSGIRLQDNQREVLSFPCLRPFQSRER